ncbi:MAG: hypothetical protein RLZZ176_2427 [Cyanobacteriota bacterium]|jgi:hypothetical protein
MKRLVLAISLVAIATPVLALTESEAEKAGRNSGRLTCQAIDRGANSHEEVSAYRSKYGSEEIYQTIRTLNTLPPNNPLTKAYFRGEDTTLKPCKIVYDDLLLR